MLKLFKIISLVMICIVVLSYSILKSHPISNFQLQYVPPILCIISILTWKFLRSIWNRKIDPDGYDEFQKARIKIPSLKRGLLLFYAIQFYWIGYWLHNPLLLIVIFLIVIYYEYQYWLPRNLLQDEAEINARIQEQVTLIQNSSSILTKMKRIHFDLHALLSTSSEKFLLSAFRNICEILLIFYIFGQLIGGPINNESYHFDSPLTNFNTLKFNYKDDLPTLETATHLKNVDFRIHYFHLYRGGAFRTLVIDSTYEFTPQFLQSELTIYDGLRGRGDAWIDPKTHELVQFIAYPQSPKLEPKKVEPILKLEDGNLPQREGIFERKYVKENPMLMVNGSVESFKKQKNYIDNNIGWLKKDQKFMKAYLQILKEEKLEEKKTQIESKRSKGELTIPYQTISEQWLKTRNWQNFLILVILTGFISSFLLDYVYYFYLKKSHSDSNIEESHCVSHISTFKLFIIISLAAIFIISLAYKAHSIFNLSLQYAPLILFIISILTWGYIRSIWNHKIDPTGYAEFKKTHIKIPSLKRGLLLFYTIQFYWIGYWLHNPLLLVLIFLIVIYYEYQYSLPNDLFQDNDLRNKRIQEQVSLIQNSPSFLIKMKRIHFDLHAILPIMSARFLLHMFRYVCLVIILVSTIGYLPAIFDRENYPFDYQLTNFNTLKFNYKADLPTLETATHLTNVNFKISYGLSSRDIRALSIDSTYEFTDKYLQRELVFYEGLQGTADAWVDLKTKQLVQFIAHPQPAKPKSTPIENEFSDEFKLEAPYTMLGSIDIFNESRELLNKNLHLFEKDKRFMKEYNSMIKKADTEAEIESKRSKGELTVTYQTISDRWVKKRNWQNILIYIAFLGFLASFLLDYIYYVQLRKTNYGN